jgi:hypothetical protein
VFRNKILYNRYCTAVNCQRRNSHFGISVTKISKVLSFVLDCGLGMFISWHVVLVGQNLGRDTASAMTRKDVMVHLSEPCRMRTRETLQTPFDAYGKSSRSDFFRRSICKMNATFWRCDLKAHQVIRRGFCALVSAHWYGTTQYLLSQVVEAIY